MDEEYDDDRDREAYMAAGDDRDMNDMLDDEYDDFNNMGEDGSSEENEAGGLGFEEIIRRNNSRHLEDDDDDDPNFSPKKNASPGLNVATIVYSSSVPNGKTGDESKKEKEVLGKRVR